MSSQLSIAPVQVLLAHQVQSGIRGPVPLTRRNPPMGQVPSMRVSCPPRGSAAFSSRRRKRATGPIGPSSLKKSVGREGIEPPQPKAADLQSAELTTLLNLPAIGALNPILPARKRRTRTRTTPG